MPSEGGQSAIPYKTTKASLRDISTKYYFSIIAESLIFCLIFFALFIIIFMTQKLRIISSSLVILNFILFLSSFVYFLTNKQKMLKELDTKLVSISEDQILQTDQFLNLKYESVIMGYSLLSFVVTLFLISKGL